MSLSYFCSLLINKILNIHRFSLFLNFFLGFHTTRGKNRSLCCPPDWYLSIPFITRFRKVIKLKLISNIKFYVPFEHTTNQTLRKCNQKIQAYMQCFYCILYEIRHVIKSYRILSLSRYKQNLHV